MQDPHALAGHIHGTFGAPGRTFHFYKRRHTAERPFFYTRPAPIHLSVAGARQVVVCGLAIEREGRYEPDAAWLLDNTETEPFRGVNALQASEAVLLAPLGDSPMVVSQTYSLLQEREGATVSAIRLIYPEGYVPARNGADLLDELCRRQKIDCKQWPIRGLKDLTSRDQCVAYGAALLQAIQRAREEHPQRQLALSLSGGRKGMSALTLFAAQYAGVERVYHTLIGDPALERQIERECGLDALRGAAAAEQIARLWLRRYPDRAAFALFPVPVIPIAGEFR
jgi:hypothetical protein